MRFECFYQITGQTLRPSRRIDGSNFAVNKKGCGIVRSHLAILRILDLPLVDHAVFHNKNGRFHFVNVSEWIAGDGDDVGPFTGFK